VLAVLVVAVLVFIMGATLLPLPLQLPMELPTQAVELVEGARLTTVMVLALLVVLVL
jgi:hypothetical protein